MIFNQQDLIARIAADLSAQAAKTPYFNIKDYMNRNWLLIPSTLNGEAPVEGSEGRVGIGARIHEILRSDSDRHLHDHPWWSISIILEGGYREWMPLHAHQDFSRDAEFLYYVDRKPGDIVFREASDRHRLELLNGPAKSLFIMGPWEQDWGFYLPEGKMYWKEYLALYGDK